ncbi:ABC transporter substrate-binding protein [Halorarum salinum]|uniref:ABC transporter substrate-binding protein n=1 Tax=Halorarum salinum TaxID=2743089 RepID=A0A7D5L8G0_9EURY|nr:hypothetical protein [Halobaculum salinum]QLG60327.1 hypothetical protein HUG12_00565 [Halobaculum salinum]
MPFDGNHERRRVLKTIGGLTATAAIAGCSGDGGDGGNGGDTGTDTGGTSTPASESVTYDATMGIVATELNQIPSLTAFRNLLSQATDEQLTGSYRTFRNSQLPMQAMVGGEIDYYALSFGNTVSASLSGSDMRVLGPKTTGTDYQMVVRTDINASNLQELVNGDYTIGVAGLGGLSHVQMAGVLAQEGLTTDVEEAGIQNIGGSSTRTSAVASGEIDATPIHIDQVGRIQSEDAPVEVLFDFREYFPSFINQAITVTQDFLDSEEGQAHVENYMQVMLEANEAATNNFDWLYENAQQLMAEPLDEEEARTSWEFNAETIETWKYEADGFNDESFQNYVEAMEAANVIDSNQVEEIEMDEILVHDYWDAAAENRQTDRWL